jgi:phosphate transport system substrate-binding protein
MKRVWFFGSLIGITVLVLGLLLSSMLVSAWGPAATPTPSGDQEVLHAIAQDYPRVDGSTSAFPLQVLIACKVFQVSCSLTYGWEPTPTLVPEREVEQISSLRHTTTHDAYVNLIEDKADFVLVAREPSEDELKAAEEQGVVLDVQSIALDAFVFLVHSDNPVDSLTIQQLHDIYTGEITNWNEVGGPDEPITAYVREPNSGSQELMKKLVMQGDPIIEGPNLLVMSMAGLIEAVLYDQSGIGYSVYYYVTFIYGENPYFKLMGVEGVAPSTETIQDGTYPFVTQVYAVVRQGEPADSTAVKLRDWLLTPAGQAVVIESGYVGLTAAETPQ